MKDYFKRLLGLPQTPPMKDYFKRLLGPTLKFAKETSGETWVFLALMAALLAGNHLLPYLDPTVGRIDLSVILLAIWNASKPFLAMVMAWNILQRGWPTHANYCNSGRAAQDWDSMIPQELFRVAFVSLMLLGLWIACLGALLLV